MTSTAPSSSRPPSQRTPAVVQSPWLKLLLVLLLLFVFLQGVNGLGDGFKSLSRDFVESFFAATSNPFVALMVGVLTTTLVQSSSVTTSLVVGLVAAPENPLPLANAIPIVMGANIGTTVTNTIVSLAHIGRKEEFRRAFAVATCHDFFNYITVIILLPLELMTGYLQRTATFLSSLVTGIGGADYDSPFRGVIEMGGIPIRAAIGLVTDSPELRAILLIGVSGVFIFIALFFLVRTMRSVMQNRVEHVVERTIGQSALLGMIVGIILTVMVQSSSITTSLMVPLAGAGLVTLPQAFPITIGANIGTTVTAFLAALAATGVNAQVGVTIALVHLLFNASGTLLIFPVPAIRNIPLAAARRLAETAVRSRRWALLYVVILFYGLPTLFAVLNGLL